MKRSDFDSLGPRASRPGLVNVIVETPGGSRSKFKYEASLGLFRLHKMLPLGAAFPYDFGFVPGTHGDDGDPLDVMVIADEPTFIGCLVTVRLLGAIEANQTERGVTIRNDRLIGVPETEKIRPTARSLDDLPERLLDELEHFFVSYNRAEGREFVPVQRSGPAAAMRLVQSAMTDAKAGGGAGENRGATRTPRQGTTRNRRTREPSSPSRRTK
jgi:inorganic pyrophosphatase